MTKRFCFSHELVICTGLNEDSLSVPNGINQSAAQTRVTAVKGCGHLKTHFSCVSDSWTFLVAGHHLCITPLTYLLHRASGTFLQPGGWIPSIPEENKTEVHEIYDCDAVPVWK